jgi:hypothetical protein
MAMSCVAEKNTMITAHTAMGVNEIAGFCNANTPIAAASASCISAIQPRRRPSQGSG